MDDGVHDMCIGKDESDAFGYPDNHGCSQKFLAAIYEIEGCCARGEPGDATYDDAHPNKYNGEVLSFPLPINAAINQDAQRDL